MIVMYWKVRGFGKSETKVTLKSLYKPVVMDLCRISAGSLCGLVWITSVQISVGGYYFGSSYLLSDFVEFLFFSEGFGLVPPSCIFPPFFFNKI